MDAGPPLPLRAKFMAAVTIDATSARFEGTISVVSLAFASSPKRARYCSATRSCMASRPPGARTASPMRRGDTSGQDILDDDRESAVA